jgi:hypothetical protein
MIISSWFSAIFSVVTLCPTSVFNVTSGRGACPKVKTLINKKRAIIFLFIRVDEMLNIKITIFRKIISIFEIFFELECPFDFKFPEQDCFLKSQ